MDGSNLVLVIDHITVEQQHLVQAHLDSKGIRTRLVRRFKMEVLQAVVEDAIAMARADYKPISDFYQPAFTRRTGENLSKVVAIVIREDSEEPLYQFTNEHPLFFGASNPPVLVIRPEQSFWIDEK